MTGHARRIPLEVVPWPVGPLWPNWEPRCGNILDPRRQIVSMAARIAAAESQLSGAQHSVAASAAELAQAELQRSAHCASKATVSPAAEDTALPVMRSAATPNIACCLVCVAAASPRTRCSAHLVAIRGGKTEQRRSGDAVRAPVAGKVLAIAHGQRDQRPTIGRNWRPWRAGGRSGPVVRRCRAFLLGTLVVFERWR